MDKIKNIMKLGNSRFKLNVEDSSFSYTVENNKIVDCDIECSFYQDEYESMIVSPKITIWRIELEKQNLNELVGTLLEINTPEESFNREDCLELLESEPFESVKVEICEIFENSIHIKMSGVAITDGYSEPYETAPFSLDVEIPIQCYQIKKEPTNENTNSKNLETAKKIKLMSILGFFLNNIIFMILISFVKSTILVLISNFITLIFIILIIVADIMERRLNKKKENR